MFRPARQPALPARLQRVGRMCLCIGLLLSGCAEIPAASPLPPTGFLAHRAAGSALVIGVLVGGWHTGLVLPAGELGPLLRSDPQGQYLGFGWGNRRFYMARPPSSGDAIAALFPSPSTLFVRAARTPADLLASAGRIHWVCVNRQEIWRVDRYIEQSLLRPDRPVDLGRGPLPDSRFYASTEPYSAVHTCNTWTVAALQYAGLQVRAGGVLFASQVEERLRGLRACPAPQ